MTAEPVEPLTWNPVSPYAWAPDPERQRRADYTMEDLLELDDVSPRIELDNGVARVVPSPFFHHQETANLLWLWFRQNAPADLRPTTEVGVSVGLQNLFEPDVLLLRQPVANRHYFLPSEVVLVVEIVSAGTRRRDRLEKPEIYARAGIPHFWRIEQEPLHVHAYDLVAGEYRLADDSETELVLSAPFPIKLPIREITP